MSPAWKRIASFFNAQMNRLSWRRTETRPPQPITSAAPQPANVLPYDIADGEAIRAATLEDIAFIAKLYNRDVTAGHYLHMNAPAEQAFAVMIGTRGLPMRTGIMATETLILTSNGERAGFAVIKQEAGYPTSARRELWFISTADEFRGRRLGSRFVDGVCSYIRREAVEISARTLKPSTTMEAMLQRRGFHKVQTRRGADRFGRPVPLTDWLWRPEAP